MRFLSSAHAVFVFRLCGLMIPLVQVGKAADAKNEKIRAQKKTALRLGPPSHIVPIVRCVSLYTKSDTEGRKVNIHISIILRLTQPIYPLSLLNLIFSPCHTERKTLGELQQHMESLRLMTNSAFLLYLYNSHNNNPTTMPIALPPTYYHPLHRFFEKSDYLTKK
jgi:hypothetical protein